MATEFQSGSPTHLLCLAVCAAVPVLVAECARRDWLLASRHWRTLAVAGCLGTWLLNTAFNLAPSRFDWHLSLPLHVCNLANLIGAAALWFRWRPARTLLHYWTFTLCVWAFLTPALSHGPGAPEFWVFWAYHLFIPVPALFSLRVDGYRPRWSDCGKAVLWTSLYLGGLALLDRATGWDYGFVGPGKPDEPSLLDVLGSYPLRLVWMWGLGMGLFALLTLITGKITPARSGKPPATPS